SPASRVTPTQVAQYDLPTAPPKPRDNGAFHGTTCWAALSREEYPPALPLRAAGCERTYAEKRSGADGERKELGRLLNAARPDDTVVVTRLDRLARSTRDLLNVLDRLGKDGVGSNRFARRRLIPRHRTDV